jgi:hypothetical protein
MKTIAFVGVLLLACTGCPDNLVGPEEVSLDREFSLQIGHEALIRGESLVIEFRSVLEDSRCPIGVYCIWAGNARIRLQVQKRGFASSLNELNTYVDPRVAIYNEYPIELIRLDPYPREQVPVDTSRYVATLRISRIQR